MTAPWHRVLRVLVFLTIFGIAGCANVPRTASTLEQDATHWQGRLALKVFNSPVQAFSANFELEGNAQTGSLILNTALGSTLARMQWGPDGAVLQTGRETRAFSSLNAMVTEITGTDIPVAGLFNWLRGNSTENAPWEVDLSGMGYGRITARRKAEPNPAELTILLDR